MEHTPTPWHVVEGSLGSIRAENGTEVAQCHMTRAVHSAADHAERIANTEHIVLCVNSHDALVKALETSRNEFYQSWHSHMSAEEFERDPVIQEIDAALSAARAPATER